MDFRSPFAILLALMEFPAEVDSLLLRCLFEQHLVRVAVSAVGDVNASWIGGSFRLPRSNYGTQCLPLHPSPLSGVRTGGKACCILPRFQRYIARPACLALHPRLHSRPSLCTCLFPSPRTPRLLWRDPLLTSTAPSPAPPRPMSMWSPRDQNPSI